MAALPSIPAVPLGLGDAGREEYIAALNQVMQSLQNRNQPNLFTVAGALLNPGRTGNVGEAISNTALEFGRQQERQEELAPSIAMMKAQLAAQKYELANQGTAMQLLASALGTSPDQAAKKVESGNVSMDELQKLIKIYPQIQTLSPKIGEIVKNMATMTAESGKIFESQRGEALKQVGTAAETPGALSLLPPQFKFNQPSAAPAPAPAVTPAPAPKSNVAPVNKTPQEFDAYLNKRFELSPEEKKELSLQYRNNYEQLLKQQQPATSGTPTAAPVVSGELSSEGLSLKKQAEIAGKRVEEADKPFVAKRNEIFNNSPDILEQSNTRLRQLDTLAAKNPDIFGLMKKQGLLMALAATAQKGINMQFGPYQGAIGADVNTFLQKVRLNEKQQQTVADIAKILGAEFLSNVKTNKGLLGTNPTDNDATLLQAPMATLDDTARSVQLWSRQQLLYNKQREEMFSSLNQHDNTVGTTAPPRSYFGSKEYKEINDKYGALRNQLFKQFYPD